MNNGQIDSTTTKPSLFEEYFSLGLEETSSPFLSPKARKWSINLTLKASILAAFLLLLAFIASFTPKMVSISYLLLIGVYFLAGIPSLIESIEDLADLNINIDVLMTLAAFSSVFIGSSMEGGLLLVLFSLSGSIEDAVTAKAKDSISTLHKLSPKKASVIDDNGIIVEKSVKDINLGTKILVKAGEMVPLDGIVIDGTSSLSLAHLTGESLPIRKMSGDDVSAGSQNIDGALTVKITRTSAESTISKIIQLVTEAQESKPNLQRWFDKLSRGYALSIISLTLLFSVTLPYILNIPFLGFEGSIYRSVAFLIAASPCALILAIPIAYLSAVSACANRGILLKGGVILDTLADCKNIAFDKTGTLTTGDLELLSIDPIGQASNRKLDVVLTLAYSVEQNTVHPIATAIINAAKSKNLKLTSCDKFRSIPGYGIEAEIQGQNLFMGQIDYIKNRISPSLQSELNSKAAKKKDEGYALAVLQIGSELYLFSFQDTLRPDLKKSIQTIKKENKWNLVMLTGDHEVSAKTMASQLGIDHYYADLKPQNKLEHITQLAKEGGVVMIGDGINDAPSLARATVGIAMGKVGSATAIEAADVILLQDNIEQVDWLLNKAIATQSIVRQNLIIAVGAIIIAAFPAIAGWVPLWLAVVMHEGGTIAVGINALRLLR